MRDWRGIVDQQIANLIGDGDVSALPGAGKPLPLDDKARTPEDWRVAHKLMRDHNVLPSWIAAGKDLDALESRLRARLMARARAYIENRAAGNSSMHARKIHAWTRFVREFREAVERYNRRALEHNLGLPAPLPHRQLLQAGALIDQALEDCRTRLADSDDQAFSG